MLQLMPADVRGTAKRHRQLYDLGLHGPDPLFYYRPVITGKGRKLGRKFHMQTGGEFFSRVCRKLRLQPNERGQAYLYGVLCHFALDAFCHPLVTQAVGPASHMRIETEFDRFLMESDGVCPPGELHLAVQTTLKSPDWELISRFYPGTDKGIIQESVWTMAKLRSVLEMRSGPARTALVKTLGFGSSSFRDMIMGELPDPDCARWNQPLLERYRQAGEAFPDMLLKLSAHLTYNAPLGEKFDPVFG